MHNYEHTLTLKLIVIFQEIFFSLIKANHITIGYLIRSLPWLIFRSRGSLELTLSAFSSCFTRSND